MTRRLLFLIIVTTLLLEQFSPRSSSHSIAAATAALGLPRPAFSSAFCVTYPVDNGLFVLYYGNLDSDPGLTDKQIILAARPNFVILAGVYKNDSTRPAYFHTDNGIATGIQVIAYIATGRGSNTEVKNQINMAMMAGYDGIFFDEVDDDDAKAGYYSDAAQKVREGGADKLVIFNPGKHRVSGWLFDCADIVSVENNVDPATGMPNWDLPPSTTDGRVVDPWRWLAVQGDPARWACDSLTTAKDRLNRFRSHGGWWYYSGPYENSSGSTHIKLASWFSSFADYVKSSNSFQGYLDVADCAFISGWAWDRTLPNDPINVAIYDNCELLAVVPANEFRQDLLNAGIGNGKHGFIFTVPASLRDRMTHSISVQVGTSAFRLINSPKTITCGTQYNGFLDAVTCDIIDGWAWDSSQPNSPINVDVYDGTTLIATLPADKFRPDLQPAGIGNGYHAFHVPLPAGLIDKQAHSVSVKFSGTVIDLDRSPKSITCGLQHQGFLDTANCNSVSGWAWDSNQPSTPINVDIYDFNNRIATVQANQFRQDLLNAGIGNGRHGFTYTFPTNPIGGFGQPSVYSRSISVKVSGTNVVLVNSPKSFTCR
jgi:Spherulation-specific family 4